MHGKPAHVCIGSQETQRRGPCFPTCTSIKVPEYAPKRGLQLLQLGLVWHTGGVL